MIMSLRKIRRQFFSDRKLEVKRSPVHWIPPNVPFEYILQDELNVNQQVTAHQNCNLHLVLFSFLPHNFELFTLGLYHPNKGFLS